MKRIPYNKYLNWRIKKLERQVRALEFMAFTLPKFAPKPPPRPFKLKIRTARGHPSIIFGKPGKR